MKKLVRIILLTVGEQGSRFKTGLLGHKPISPLAYKLISLLLVSFFCLASSPNVGIEVKDAGEADDKWHFSLDPAPLQFKHFEAIVRDSTGRQHAIVATVAGNEYMYEAHAWLANADQWYEIYKATPKMKSERADVWTDDGKLSYTGNMSTGWRIKAEGVDAGFEVASTPERPVSQYSVTGSSAEFDGYISFRTKVDGKVVVDHRSMDVSGLGYCIHTFGDMGDHTAWRYVGFRDEKLCVTAMNAQFDMDRLNLFVAVDNNMNIDQYKPDEVSWKELDQNTWQISATSGRANSEAVPRSGSQVEKQDGRRIEMIVRLIKPRPTNKDQPYARYSLGFIDLSKTILYEYLSEVRVTVTDPDGQMELRSLGVAIEFDLIRD